MFVKYISPFFGRRTSAGLGRPAAEVNVTWQMLSPPLTDKESRVLHLSDSLQGLGPDYCFEIQWRKTEELPYGGSIYLCLKQKLLKLIRPALKKIMDCRQFNKDFNKFFLLQI